MNPEHYPEVNLILLDADEKQLYLELFAALNIRFYEAVKFVWWTYFYFVYQSKMPGNHFVEQNKIE